MADIADAFHIYGQDLAVTATGDIALATKSDRTIQRIIRRLLTRPTDARSSSYPMEPDYGVGMGARIGQAIDVNGIRADVRSQMLLEATVAKSPAPVITVTPFVDGTGVTIGVTYTDISGVPQGFSFNLAPPG